MSRTERVVAAALFIASGLAACASPASPSIAACQSNEGCPAGARCIASACVENSAPTARFTVNGALQAGAEVALDATSSSDPDEGDSIVEYAWTVTKTAAECDAPTVASKTQQVTVVFVCAGTYEVSLSVTDEMQAGSAPSKTPVVVTGRTGPVLVEAGPAQTVEHTCGGTPLECRPASAIQLSATLPNPSFQNVRWTVVPPPGREVGNGSGRTVTFLPGPNVRDPTVEVKTDGVAISGDWSFRVEVVNGDSVLDSAVTRVSINNRAPTIGGGPPAAGFNHQFVVTNQSYSAAGSFPVQIVDPDGDAVTTRLTYQHTGDGEATFSAWPLPAEGTPSQIGFDVGALRSAELIADGIQRTVVVLTTDVNGGTGSATFPVVIENRPPVRALAAETLAFHSFDAQSYLYTSTPRIGRWTDPDGDPVSYEVTTESTDCPEYATDAQGTLRLLCAAGAPLSAFVRSGRTATVDVGDPWATVRVADIAFGIGNRRPIVVPTVYQPAVSCVSGGGSGHGSCSVGPSYTPPNSFSAISSLAPTGVSDPDGDPLELQPAADAVLTICPPQTASCSLRLAIPVQYACSPEPPTQTISVVATDGVASTSATLTVDPHCR